MGTGKGGQIPSTILGWELELIETCILAKRIYKNREGRSNPINHIRGCLLTQALYFLQPSTTSSTVLSALHN
jgi:hypothetical protein